jgi:DNA-binding CsgD family transcriptional regulator
MWLTTLQRCPAKLHSKDAQRDLSSGQSDSQEATSELNGDEAMFRWTDSEVSQVVRLILRSIRDASEATGAGRSALMAGVAQALGASAWQIHMGRLAPTADGPRLLWTIDECVDEDMRGCEMPALTDRYSDAINKLSTELHQQDEIAVEIDSQKYDCAAGRSHDALACLTISADGLCKAFEFIKRCGAEPFSVRDQALLRVLSKELHSGLRSSAIISQNSHAHDPATDETRHEPSVGSDFSVLPRRQRQVLENLLLGLNAKEIAREMGLSPYTVNDYIKALYRRYQVSSRGELMASIHGHRRVLSRR